MAHAPTGHVQGCTHARIAAAQAFKLWMGAIVLVHFTGPKSPLFDVALAAGPPPAPTALGGSRLFIVADIGHYELIGKGGCAGVDVLGEIQSRAVLGQEVRGLMSTPSTPCGYPNVQPCCRWPPRW